jgi:Mrp family chromosome partitioning ATPase
MAHWGGVMMASQRDERSDFGALAGILRRRLWLVVVAVIAAVGAALFYSHQQPKQYQSSAVLLFRQVLLDVQLTGVPLQVPSSDATVESATDVGLLSQDNVRAGAAAQLGPPYTAASLKNQVNISPQNKSNLVEVQATADTPQEAARIANAVAGSFLQIANQQTVSDITAAQNRVRSQISVRNLTPAQRTTLRGALVKLSVLASLGPQNVHLVQPAVPPTSPSSPKPVRNAIIGGLIGLVIGLALAFGVEQFDRRLRRPEEIERETGLPLLATVPRSRWLRRPQRTTKRLDIQDTEPFRRLASNLRHRTDDGAIRSVLITSSGPESGKTTVALYLAAAAAAGLGSRVFLLEADLRRPRLGTLLNLPSERGLSTLLQDGQDERPAIQTIELSTTEQSTNGDATTGTSANGDATTEPGDNGDATTDSPAGATINGIEHPTLSLLLAGPRSTNATMVFESAAMRNLIRRCREDYELTVIDGPPPGLVADAVPLAKAVDAVIIVARLGKDTGADIRDLRTDLERLGIHPIGIVANYGRRRKNPYYKKPRR